MSRTMPPGPSVLSTLFIFLGDAVHAHKHTSILTHSEFNHDRSSQVMLLGELVVVKTHRLLHTSARHRLYKQHCTQTMRAALQQRCRRCDSKRRLCRQLVC